MHPPSPFPARHARGFSLVELLITLVVLGILIRLAIPSMTNFLDESARSRMADEFVVSMIRARSQAITSGQPVFVCPRASNSDVMTVCGTGTDWSNGLYVFSGTAADGVTPLLTEASILWEYAPDNSPVASGVPKVSITAITDSSKVAVPGPLITFSAVGRISNTYALWRICRTRGPQMQNGSVAVVQFNGAASLEPTTTATACPVLAY